MKIKQEVAQELFKSFIINWIGENENDLAVRAGVERNAEPGDDTAREVAISLYANGNWIELWRMMERCHFKPVKDTLFALANDEKYAL